MKQGFKKLLGMMGIMSAMGGEKATFKDSKDVQGKDEGRQSPIYSFISSSNPIYIPSRSQKIKSKRLAKRNAMR